MCSKSRVVSTWKKRREFVFAGSAHPSIHFNPGTSAATLSSTHILRLYPETRPGCASAHRLVVPSTQHTTLRRQPPDTFTNTSPSTASQGRGKVSSVRRMLGGDSQQDCSWVFQSTQRHPKDSDTIAWLRPCLREVKSSEEWCAPRSSWKKGLLASYGSSKLYYSNVGGSFSEKYRSTTFPNARLSSPIRSYLEDLLRALHTRSPPS